MNELERLKRELFFLEMKTCKDSVDHEQIQRLTRAIKELEEDERETI